MKIVDDSYGTDSQDYNLTRVYDAGEGLVVRVRVKRDSYQQQSYAVAELLNGDRQWTPLVNAPTSSWYEATPGVYDSRTNRRPALVRVADGLAARAATVLATLTGQR